MNKKTLEQLDYFRIRDTVAGFCMSEEGRSMLLERLPFTDRLEMERAKAEAAEWTSYISSGSAPILSPWQAIRPLFPVLGVDGAVLELHQVYALGQFCRAVLHIKKALGGNEATGNAMQGGFDSFVLPRLSALANELPDVSAAESEIFKIIDNSGQMRDLPSIRAIRSSIQAIRGSIDRLIKSYTSDSRLQDALQSNIPTLRANRQVLAVKANYRGRLKGIVHEVSQTGQTLYIEPDDVVQKNNDLVQEEFHLAQEIRRILKELTGRLAEFQPDFDAALCIMLRFDCAYAAARWGVEKRCIFALDCTKVQPLTLLQARHPLLGDKAVPIDVEFRDMHRVLIITGPNTGGKTVTLKTIALFSVLNQSGFPIPANEGSYLPFFKSVFADIGDEQSLDQSLSTFSGHMKNIGEMIGNANEDSLVLLDELGSGTDPQEGAAIAMSVLDHLITQNAFVLATTHQGVLKNYGYTHPTCINASVEFNEHTLRPTYRILMGVPGESHALDIAQKSGLSSEVVTNAKGYIENRQADVSALIKGLNEKHEELSRIELDFKQKERYINEKWRKVDLKELKLRQKETELQEQGYRRSKDFLEQNRRMLENLVRELREGEITREKTLKVKQAIEQMTQSVESEKSSLEADKESFEQLGQTHKDRLAQEEAELRHSTHKTNSTKGVENKKSKKATFFTHNIRSENFAGETMPFQKGNEVFVGATKTQGTILDKAKKGSWLVQTGSLKLTVKENDLQHAPSSQTNSSPSIIIEMESSVTQQSGKTSTGTTGLKGHTPPSGDRPQFELRLLGMHLEEAIKTLERQLDLCALYDLTQFSVIHGKGNGVLQQGVQDYLSHYTGVTDFRFAPPEDGGTGKTYVKLG